MTQPPRPLCQCYKPLPLPQSSSPSPFLLPFCWRQFSNPSTQAHFNAAETETKTRNKAHTNAQENSPSQLFFYFFKIKKIEWKELKSDRRKATRLETKGSSEIKRQGRKKWKRRRRVSGREDAERQREQEAERAGVMRMRGCVRRVA